MFLVDGTAPLGTTLTVSGLPAGFEFYDDYLMIAGTPTRTMSTTITVTLTNAAGTKTKKIPFVVVAPEDEDEDPASVDFVETEMTVAEGEKAKVAVWGGSADGPCDVKLYLALASADAKDLDLTKLTVDGVTIKKAKFPLTLSWAAGDVSVKVIEIAARS